MLHPIEVVGATPQQFFVYGTLKRGQQRSGLWPHPPLSIQPAWASGMLFDGPGYPAMRINDQAMRADQQVGRNADRVLGELWSFRAEHTARVIKVLDQIEGTNRPNVANLYDRVIVQTFGMLDQSLGDAWGYHYATNPLDDGFTRVHPADPTQRVTWPISY